GGSGSPRSFDDRVLFGDPEWRLCEINEPSFVLEQRGARPLAFRRGDRRRQVLAARPPELRHPVVGLGPAAGLAQRVVQGVLQRADLDVAPDAEGGGVAADHGAGALPPVAMEVRGREPRPPTKAKDELDHGALPSKDYGLDRSPPATLDGRPRTRSSVQGVALSFGQWLLTSGIE